MYRVRVWNMIGLNKISQRHLRFAFVFTLFLSIPVIIYLNSLHFHPSFSWTKTVSNEKWKVPTLVERIEKFNLKLERLRSDILRYSSLRPSVKEYGDDFTELDLPEFPQMRTFALPWFDDNRNDSVLRRQWSSLSDISNILIQKYYAWTSSIEYCDIFAQTQTDKNLTNNLNRTCPNISSTIEERSLEPFYFSETPTNEEYRWPISSYHWYLMPDYAVRQTPKTVFQLHIIRDAGITDIGDVVSENLTVMFSCRPRLDVNGSNVDITTRLFEYMEKIRQRSIYVQFTLPNGDRPKNVTLPPLYKEVYIAVQLYGRPAQYYHFMSEVMPRLAVHLDFLRRNPDIKILVNEQYTKPLPYLLGLLGVDESRFVTGVVRAQIAYLPRSYYPFNSFLPEVQVLADEYRRVIRSRFPGPHKRDRLILIQRTSRGFEKPKPIVQMLESAAKNHSLRYTIFFDQALPSLNETMQMFYTAVMIVAPHGGGLANLLFCQPGTYVVEAIWNNRFTFQRLAHVLGHHYHGLASLEAVGIDEAVKQLLSIYEAQR